MPLPAATGDLAPSVTLPGDHHYVFICGLHRSGTTLITRALAQHPGVSGFAGTGAIEDEGQFLQSVFPVENTLGGVGRFGFDPRAHMTEDSALNTPRAAATLRAEWHRYWDESKAVLVEKTPSNLLRMRLLQQLFQPSSFVIVTRHPIATALATIKWTEGNLFSLLCHWVHCYRLARADSALVSRAHWLSYEEFVAEPRRELERLSRFLGLAPFSDWRVAVQDQNAAYFTAWREGCFGDGERAIEQKPPERRRSLVTRLRDRWQREMRERALPAYRRHDNLRRFHDALDAVALFEPDVASFGYSLTALDRRPGK